MRGAGGGVSIPPSSEPAWRPMEEQEAGGKEEKENLPVGTKEQRDP